jgi:hypothetical protein
MSSADKLIVFLGQTFSGRVHDYTIPVRGKPSQGTLLKTEFPVKDLWFKDVAALFDLGYQGVQKDYKGACIRVPHKKPRKNKRNQKPQLTDPQKQENRALAKLRIFIEHAIGGIKRYRILVTPYRNHKANFEDDVVVISAGLWDLWLL